MGNRRKEEAAEAQHKAKGVAFAAPGEMGTSISAGVIPINSMYEGDEADQDDGSRTPIIEETKEEHV